MLLQGYFSRKFKKIFVQKFSSIGPVVYARLNDRQA